MLRLHPKVREGWGDSARAREREREDEEWRPGSAYSARRPGVLPRPRRPLHPEVCGGGFRSLVCLAAVVGSRAERAWAVQAWVTPCPSPGKPDLLGWCRTRFHCCGACFHCLCSVLLFISIKGWVPYLPGPRFVQAIKHSQPCACTVKCMHARVSQTPRQHPRQEQAAWCVHAHCWLQHRPEALAYLAGRMQGVQVLPCASPLKGLPHSGKDCLTLERNASPKKGMLRPWKGMLF